jgi:Acetyltransferase (GNAT) domain
MRDRLIARAAKRSLAAAVEERLLVPAYASSWRFAPITAHRGLALSLQLAGRAQRWKVPTENGLVEILGIGREKLIQPICTRLFGTLPEPRIESRRTLWNPYELAKGNADLVIAEVHRWVAPRFQRAGWLAIPDAVRWQGDLDSLPPLTPNRSLREDLRKAATQGYTIEHCTAQADWDEFYTTMVRPQALARHGDAAWLPSPHFMRRLALIGTVHLVSQHGRRVAGLCTLGEGETVWSPLAGVRNGDPVLLRQGAAVAALALTLGWARSRGYRRIDLGRTTAFLNDGLQAYKRKWGLSPALDPLSHMAAVWIGSDAAREAFSREPLLVEDGTSLRVYAGEPT